MCACLLSGPQLLATLKKIFWRKTTDMINSNRNQLPHMKGKYNHKWIQHLLNSPGTVWDIFYLLYSTQTRHASKTPVICFMSHRHLCSVRFADDFFYLRVENVLCIKFWLVCKLSLAQRTCPTQEIVFSFTTYCYSRNQLQVSSRKSLNVICRVVLGQSL